MHLLFISIGLDGGWGDSKGDADMLGMGCFWAIRIALKNVGLISGSAIRRTKTVDSNTAHETKLAICMIRFSVMRIPARQKAPMAFLAYGESGLRVTVSYPAYASPGCSLFHCNNGAYLYTPSSI